MTWFSDLQTGFHSIGKRIRGLAMISRGIVPNLVLSQRVVDRVKEASKHFLADETGETMVGIVLPPHGDTKLPTIYVLETISPDETTIRRSHMFEQGDDRQADIFAWLEENWTASQKLNKDCDGNPLKPEWKQPLRHVGDWHKQPGFMIQPSGGDLQTALDSLADAENGFEFLLVPIVTLGHDTVTAEGTHHNVNYFTVPQPNGTSLRMDWWYIHRDGRFFQPITPKIVPEKDIPTLAPVAWHLHDSEQFKDELALLTDAGYFLIGNSVITWQSDNTLPLEICAIIGRPASNQVVLLSTTWDYPKSAPKAFVAPFSGIDPSMYPYQIFEKLWQSRKDAPLKNFKWTDETFLVDLVNTVYDALGVAPIPAKTSKTGTTSAVKITVETDQKQKSEKEEDDDDTDNVESR